MIEALKLLPLLTLIMHKSVRTDSFCCKILIRIKANPNRGWQPAKNEIQRKRPEKKPIISTVQASSR
jgi:hypothetical protein